MSVVTNARRRSVTWIALGAGVLLSSTGLARSVDDPPAPPPASPQPAPASPSAPAATTASATGQPTSAAAPASPPKGLRSLDEQLGLTPTPAGGPGGAAPVPTPNQQDLTDRLNDTKLEDSFKEAIALMNRAASRLSDHRDVSIDTQRIQEEAIRRLDQTLSEAKKRQQKQKQSSSSSSSQQNSQPQQTDAQGQQPQQPQSGMTPEERARQEAAQRAAAQRAAEANANLSPPEREREALRAALEASRAAWGNLPERVRQSLMQGSGEKFSTVYQQMTVDYYKRLAEQSAGGGGAGAGGPGNSGGGR